MKYFLLIIVFGMYTFVGYQVGSRKHSNLLITCTTSVIKSGISTAEVYSFYKTSKLNMFNAMRAYVNHRVMTCVRTNL